MVPELGFRGSGEATPAASPMTLPALSVWGSQGEAGSPPRAHLPVPKQLFKV